MDGMVREKEFAQLKAELTQKENDLVLAAEIGKKLLEQNSDLEDQLDQLAQDHVKKIEQLEQDKYSLQIKLNSKEQVEKSQAAELETLRESLQGQRELSLAGERQEIAHGKEIHRMTSRLEELQISLERAAMTEEQLRKKIEQQDELLKDAHNKLSSIELEPSRSDEQLYGIQRELALAKSDKGSIAMELRDTSNQCQQLAFTVEAQKQQLQNLQSDIEAKEQRITSYFNLHEKSQEQIADLEIQLDVARMEATDVNRKGNSLFAEVEDRRKEAENKLISLTVQYESVKDQLNMKKQQVHKMRFQIAALLQMGSGRADSSQRERLEQSLAQSRSEVHMLTEKIKALEKAKANEGIGHQFEEYKRLISESDKPDLVEFLEYKLKTAKTKMEAIRKELHTQQLLQIAASDKLMDCERRLYSAETETDRARAANMKLLVKLDEMKHKLNIKENGSSRPKVYREKICLRPDECKTGESTKMQCVGDPTTESVTDAKNTGACQETRVEDESKLICSDHSQVSCDVTPLLANQEVPNKDYVLKPSNQNRPPVLLDGLPGKKRPKKSVSMCETVSVLEGTERIDVTQSQLKSGDDGDKKPQGQDLEGSSDTVDENTDPQGGTAKEAGIGRARHGGKRHHKVVYMKSNNAAECKQQ